MPDTSPLHASRSAAPRPDGPARRFKLQVLAAQLQLLLDPIGTVSRRFARYGDTYRVLQPTGPLYVTRHPDHIKDVLVTNATAFGKQHTAFRLLSEVLGDALLTSDGERWRRQRRLLQPAFAKPRLLEYATTMVEEASARADALGGLGRSGTVDLSREMNRLTLGIVTRTLFGQALEDGGRTRDAMRELGRWFATPRALSRFIPRAQQRFEAAVSTLDAVIAQLVDAKLAEQKAGIESSDLLSTLIAARDEQGEGLSARELRDQLLTLYLAGHETTSHALTWTLYLLTQHPNETERLVDECARVLGDRLPAYSDLADLPLTEQVLKEALRLYPPAFVIPRKAREATAVGPYPVPRGSEVVIWVYCTHRDPQWYPEPDRFRPERFAPERELERPKFAYLPFGAGQRACIGQQFAMIEAQLILATLVPRLRFEYAGRRPPKLLSGVTLAPRGGMPMRVRARKS